MYQLVKSITNDFPLGITHHHLVKEIIDGGISYCKEIYQNGDTLVINFTSDYTSDLATINSIITNYKPVPAYFDDLKFVTITSSNSPYQAITKSVKCNTTGGNITVLLPKSHRAKHGVFVIHKIAAANIVTISPNGVETINGGNSLQLTDLGSYYTLTNDGSNWISIISQRINTSVNETLVETMAAGDLRIDSGDGLAPLPIGADNQVLIADSTQPLKMRWGNVAGGSLPICTQISDTDVSSTTSENYVTINNMSTTPVSGNYLVLFSGTGTVSKSAANVYYGIYVDGSLIANSERCYKGATSTTHSMHTHAKITVNGSQIVEIRYKTSTGTFTVNTRSMVLVTVA